MTAPTGPELAAVAKTASVAAAKAKDALDRRDAWIRAAVLDGVSLRTVAKFVGLSHEQVRIIAGRETDQ